MKIYYQKMRFILGFLSLTAWFLPAFSQNAPFSLSLEPVNMSEQFGVQSFAFGQANGKWLILGGRLDGLHRRQPFAAFDLAGHNNQITVIDPISGELWKAPLESLSADLREQLSSTNMEFIQTGQYLYVIGGYGYSATLGDHTTFPFLTAIDVPGLVTAVLNGDPIETYFRQIEDEKFQVTGGRLRKIDEVFHLLAGQKFLGRYNPMGPTHGPGFVQEYTNQVRKFTLADDGQNLQINHLPSLEDEDLFHRRDYNAEPQIMPDGSQGITMFSGVFQKTINLPYQNAVNITGEGYGEQFSFRQFYNHYHCASIPLYDAESNEMHTVFLGGIAQYYLAKDKLIRDDEVPFVKTIARVTREPNGDMKEYKLPVELTGLLGAGSEFIPVNGLEVYDNGVIKLDALGEKKTKIGYLVGGINSSATNIFFTNTGSQSEANATIYAVYIQKSPSKSTDVFNTESYTKLNIRIIPNPNEGQFKISYQMKTTRDARMYITNQSGQSVFSTSLVSQQLGENSYLANLGGRLTPGVYYVTIHTYAGSDSQKVIIE